MIALRFRREAEEETSSRQIDVVLNCFEELKQRIPSGARLN